MNDNSLLSMPTLQRASDLQKGPSRLKKIKAVILFSTIKVDSSLAARVDVSPPFQDNNCIV